MIDSVSWTCRDCGGTFVGDRPPDGRCGQCLAGLRRRLGEEHQRQNHEVHSEDLQP